MQDINITVTAEEAIAIVQVLGQLPTSSGAFPLLMKIKQQFDAQSADQNALPEQ